MRYGTIVWIVSLLILSGSAVFAEEPALQTDKEKISYSIGLNIGTNIKQEPIDVDIDLLVRGIKDAFSGSPALLSEEEVQAALEGLQNQLNEKKEAERKVIS